MLTAPQIHKNSPTVNTAQVGSLSAKYCKVSKVFAALNPHPTKTVIGKGMIIAGILAFLYSVQPNVPQERLLLLQITRAVSVALRCFAAMLLQHRYVLLSFTTAFPNPCQ